MKKLAIVVQRCHEKVVGGSEAEAWHYANLLKSSYEIHILTTTAVDFERWDNVLPEGDEKRDGICIKRFKVTQGRAEYWEEINRQLLDEFASLKSKYNSSTKLFKRLIELPIALQEEFIYKQGPYSDDLMGFLSEKSEDYKAVIFLTYLYPTTYFGMFRVPTDKIILVPTLHDEPPAYLSVYKYMAERSRIILWNTDSEYRFGRSLWGELPGHVVGMGVETKEFPPAKLNYPYLLYCGRIDINKGCPQLIDYFLKYKEDCPSDLHLILTGDNKIELPRSEYIEFKGSVSEEEKLKLISGANFFIMPSPNESFSIVTLEAMAQRTPVLASEGSEVIIDHIKKSDGGLLYNDYESFKYGINFLLENKQKVKEMGIRGRSYVIENYSTEKISKKLNDIIEAIE
jgi:glycosyltransferase involved in cell wall biosynthesis